MASSKKSIVKKTVSKNTLPKPAPKSNLKTFFIILILAIAGALAIVVSARVSQQASVSPTAPESEPYAREITPTPSSDKCKKGEKKCVGDNVVVCGTTGKWEYSRSCFTVGKCSGGTCVKK